jgi:hypothetical protein
MAVEKMDKPTLMIGKHVSGTVIGAVRNWSRNVVRRIRPLNRTQTMAAARSARERSP